MHDEDVEQTMHLVNVMKGLIHLRGFFATLDVRKLIVRQVEADDEYGLVDKSLILF